MAIKGEGIRISPLISLGNERVAKFSNTLTCYDYYLLASHRETFGSPFAYQLGEKKTNNRTKIITRIDQHPYKLRESQEAIPE